MRNHFQILLSNGERRNGVERDLNTIKIVKEFVEELSD